MAGGKRSNQADQRADLRGGAWIGLPKVVFESAAYRAASPAAKVILMEVLARFNGFNNGDINLDIRTATAALCKKNQAEAGEAFAELMQLGLLDLAEGCIWQQRRSRRWRLTFATTGHPPNVRRATNDYERWKPADAVQRSKPSRKFSGTRSVADEAETATRGEADPHEPCYAGRSSADAKPPKMPDHSATRGVAVISKPYGEALSELVITPEIAGGPDQETLRKSALALIRTNGRGTQGRLALAAGIAEPKLSTFLNHRTELPPASAARLARELNRWREAA
jgi:hypothetical protein